MAQLNIIHVDLEDFEQFSIQELEEQTTLLERHMEKLRGERWKAIDNQDEELLDKIEDEELKCHRKLYVLEDVITAKEIELYGHRPIESRY